MKIIGTDGNDSLVGTAKNDTLQGLAGDDLLFGGAGNDKLEPGTGNDTIDAGTGNDTIIGDTENDTVIGGDGNDYLIKDLSDQTTAVNFSYTDPNSGSIQGIETVTLYTGSGDDTIVSTAAISNDYYYTNYIVSNDGNDSITTGTGNDDISSGAGDDSITTDAGNDYIYADDGNDTIKAGAGNDYIYAGKGKDQLSGGYGNDTLTGGNGQDRFIFQTPARGIDRIYDFTVSDDTIAVSQSGFGDDLIAGAAITEEQFIIGSAATTATQRFIYDSSSEALLFDADGVGGTAAIQFATLNTGLALTNADIYVIA